MPVSFKVRVFWNVECHPRSALRYAREEESRYVRYVFDICRYGLLVRFHALIYFVNYMRIIFTYLRSLNDNPMLLMC